MRALISVSDKSGVENFAKELVSLGYEIISTGGTYNKLKDAGIKVIEANEVTKFPECFEGRVKTLNPIFMVVFYTDVINNLILMKQKN